MSSSSSEVSQTSNQPSPPSCSLIGPASVIEAVGNQYFSGTEATGKKSKRKRKNDSPQSHGNIPQ